jgi:lysophospholipase L1-like esterase
MNILLPDSDAYSNWNTVQKYFLDMKQLSDQTNAKFLVLIIPDEFQVNKTLRKDVAEYIKISVDQLDMTLPQRTVKTFFDQHNIQYIDLLKEWESSPAAERYYLPRNTHLSIEGNKVVADMLYPKIIELLQ